MPIVLHYSLTLIILFHSTLHYDSMTRQSTPVADIDNIFRLLDLTGAANGLSLYPLGESLVYQATW